MKSTVRKYVIALGICAVLLSCNKDAEENIEKAKVDITDPTQKGTLEFEAGPVGATTFKVGDTVKFAFQGNADLVNFYSGAFGNAYDYIDKDRFYDITANLSFRSSTSPNNGSPVNYECAQLVYSTDFNGEQTYNNVISAMWIPITDRFELPTGVPKTITDYVNSGVGDISDIFEEGKPVYLAWHCTTQAGSSRVQFRVIETSLKGVVIDNSALSKELYTQGDMNFKWVENQASAEQTSNRPSVSTTQLQWNGIFNNTAGPLKEGYAISKALELPQFNAGKDKPTILLPKNDGKWSTHTFIYDRPGTYEVVFVASRLGASNESDIVKKMTITIEE